jgi:predicted Zn-dependent protease
MTMSPEREAAIGRQAAKEVEQQIGLVRDPALVQYVEKLGRRIAEKSPRQDVTYRFHVADMEVPNAFALPGGYIYVSRGLLLLTNDEAELAGVIGHEIGHVAAHHAAKQESRSTRVGVLSALGTLAGAVLGGSTGAAVASDISRRRGGRVGHFPGRRRRPHRVVRPGSRAGGRRAGPEDGGGRGLRPRCDDRVP